MRKNLYEQGTGQNLWGTYPGRKKGVDDFLSKKIRRTKGDSNVPGGPSEEVSILLGYIEN